MLLCGWGSNLGLCECRQARTLPVNHTLALFFSFIDCLRVKMNPGSLYMYIFILCILIYFSFNHTAYSYIAIKSNKKSKIKTCNLLLFNKCEYTLNEEEYISTAHPLWYSSLSLLGCFS